MSTPSKPACDTPMMVSVWLLTVIVLPTICGSGAEAGTPVVVAQHRHRAVAALLVVVGRDDAADRRADAEHLEIGAGDQLARHALGLAVRADVHRHRPPREHAGEYRRRGGVVGDRRRDARRSGAGAADRRSCRGSLRTSGTTACCRPSCCRSGCAAPLNRTSWSGSLTGSRLSSTSSTSVKIAVFAPMPSAIDRSATAVKSGERASPRKA